MFFFLRLPFCLLVDWMRGMCQAIAETFLLRKECEPVLGPAGCEQLEPRLLLSSSFYSTDTPKPIPDAGGDSLESVIAVSGLPGVITDVDVAIEISHEYVGDLRAKLVKSSGQEVELFRNVGGDGQGFVATTLDDDVSRAIQDSTQVAPFVGRFQPRGNLSLLDDIDPNDEWTLQIEDTTGKDVGTLEAWSLSFSVDEPVEVTPQLISQGFGGVPTDDRSLVADISSDGRFAVFTSKARNLESPLDINFLHDVFVHDRLTGEIDRVSVRSSELIGGGERANAISGFRVSITADGRFVGFETNATNITDDPDNNGNRDVFLHDVQTGITQLISVSLTGQTGDGEGNSSSNDAFVSGDGRLVVFSSRATDLVIGDVNGTLDVFVRDLSDPDNPTTELVTNAFDGGPSDRGGFPRGMSADGRFVLIRSGSTNLVPDDTNGVTDLFVYDRLEETMELVAVAPDGSSGGGATFEGNISDDGRFVVFRSFADNLIPGVGGSEALLYLKDRSSGTTEHVSIASDGATSNGVNKHPSVSADGRYVSFISNATNLDPLKTGPEYAIFVRDRLTGLTKRFGPSLGEADPDSPETQSGGIGILPFAALSADGRQLFFESPLDLGDEDTNGKRDVFVIPITFEIPEDPLVRVLGSDVIISDGGDEPRQVDGTDFEIVTVGGAGSERTFEVRNFGMAALGLGAVEVPQGFTVVEPLASSLAFGESDQFTVRLDAEDAIAGTRGGDIRFTTSDPSKPEFNFAVSGQVKTGVPRVEVSGNGQNISDGDRMPTTLNGTDFGAADVASGSVERTFVIKNTGTAALVLTGDQPVQIKVPDVMEEDADFSVVSQPPAQTALDPGEEVSFVVQFDPHRHGVRSGRVRIGTEEGVFDFEVAGKGGDIFEAEGDQINLLISVEGIQSSIVVSDLDDKATPVGSSPAVLVQIDHPMVEQLTVSLIGPDDATTVLLFEEVLGEAFGQGLDNIVFDDDAGASVVQGASPFTGVFRPQGLLSDLAVNQRDGVWNLEIVDGVDDGVEGRLLGWSLVLPRTETGDFPAADSLIEPGTGVSLQDADAFEEDNHPDSAIPITTDGQPHEIGGVMNHNINAGGLDQDWVTFTLQQASNVVIETKGPSAADTVIFLKGDGVVDNENARADDGGDGHWSRLERRGNLALASGQYFVQVVEWNNNDPISEYFISVDAQPVATSITVEGGVESLVIPDNDSTPSQDDFTDFGSVQVGDLGPMRTFIVRNNSQGMVTLNNLVVPGGFALRDPLSDTQLMPDETAQFTVELMDTSSARGITDDIELSFNDGGVDVYNFAVAAMVVDPTLDGVRFTATINDSAGEFVDLHDEIQAAMAAAGSAWSSRIDGVANLEVLLSIQDLDPGIIAIAESETITNIGIDGGFTLFEPGTITEILTGVDPNTTVPDIAVTVNSAFLRGDTGLWFDPDPVSDSSIVPVGRHDAITVLTHEFAHALGFFGFRSGDGSLPGDAKSTFDRHIAQIPSGEFVFQGPKARSANGNADVALSDPSQFDVYHLVKGSGQLMAPEIPRGERRLISSLELAMLADAGLPVKLPQLGDVKKLEFIDADGTLITAKLSGAGTLSRNGPDLSVTGTDGKSRLTISTGRGGSGNGRADLNDITIDGPIKGLTGKNTDLSGDLTVAGLAASVSLGNIADQHVISLGGTPADKPIKLNFGKLTDVTLTSGAPINTLTAIDWQDTDATRDSVTAPWIKSLSIKGDRKDENANGDFEPDLNLDGTGSPKLTLGRAKILGDVHDAIWNLTGDSGTVDIRGAVDDWTLNVMSSLKGLKLGRVNRADVSVEDDLGTARAVEWKNGSITANTAKGIQTKGDRKTPGVFGDFGADVTLEGDPEARKVLGSAKVAGVLGSGDAADRSTWRINGPAGSVTAGAVRHAQLLVGMENGLEGLANAASNFSNLLGELKTLKVKGIRSETSGDANFVNSILSAASIGAVDLSTVQTNNGGNRIFGLASTTFKSVSYIEEGGDGKKKRLKVTDLPLILDDLVVRLV